MKILLCFQTVEECPLQANNKIKHYLRQQHQAETTTKIQEFIVVCVTCQKNYVSSVVEWLKHQACDEHSLSLKPTCAILLCPWERHFTVYSPAWWSWQAVLNYSHISIKLQADNNILVSPEAGWGNCLPYVLAPLLLSCESGG